MKSIQIFKPGKHTAMSGAVLDFTESDLRATVSAYDPAKHEAPIVIGHPKDNAPAYGWVKSLGFADGMEAVPDQVDPAFAEMVSRGAFKKVSASFYAPDSPQNPVPGVFYLRHVGFLGAQPPAVKGLRAPEFAEDEQGIVEFGDMGDMMSAGLWRRMRDWIISFRGLDEADKVIPDYAVAAIEDAARNDDPDDSTAGAGGPAQFSETKGNTVTPEEKSALEAENAALKKQLLESAARDKAAKAASRHGEHVAFADGLLKEGKLLPGNKDMAVAVLDFMSGQEQVVEFGEGDAKKPLVDGFRAFLQAQPKQVEFREVGNDKGGKGGGVVEFAAPAGYQVDQGRLELHQKALSYQESNKVDYVTAVKAVS